VLKVLLKGAVIFWLFVYVTRIAIYFLYFDSPLKYYISFSLPFFFIAFLVVWYIKKEGSRDTLTLKDMRWQTGLWAFLLCISQFLLLIVFYGNPIWRSKNEMTMTLFLASFFMVFCSPVVEEIVFRGLLQKQLSKKLAPWLTILITSIVFAITHFGNVINVIPALLIGIFCGIIYYKTGKLIACILYHSFFNLMGAISQFTFKYSLILQVSSFIFAAGLAIYSIRGLMNDTTLNRETVT
jgi:membrane protease YdiL (CAAX protease family)